MFENRGKIIRDGAPLDFAYIPDSLIGRREQCEALEASFRPLFFDGVPCTAYLRGGAGSGKTVTARRFSEDLTQAFVKAGKALKTVYVNCRIRNSEHALLLDLIRNFDPGFPDRGFSLEEMLASFRKHVESGARPVVVILDEADAVMTQSGKNTVYQLTRMSEGMRPGASVSLIMISQKPLSSL